MPEDAAQKTPTETRKLAAIMFTDIVGFSRQMGADEARMLRLLVVLGVIYMGKKQYEQAIAEAERAISLAPNSSLVYGTLVAILNVTGQAEKAIEVLKQAQRRDPNSSVLYQINLGWSYLLTRRYDEVIAT